MIYQLFKDGQAIKLKNEREVDTAKAGNLRGGNSSLMLPDGKIVGGCINLTYLRFKGIPNQETTPEDDLMFDAGRRNEDHWYDVLSQSWDGKILRETEIPTNWKTSDGTSVTGRPDIVLADKDGKLVTGIELKLVSSLWTARDVKFQGKPKLSHLIQAAHYSWQLGVPFELWYTCRADFAVTGDWAKNIFPKAGEPGSEFCEYAYYKEGAINPKTKKPVKHKIDHEEYMLGQAKGEKVSCDILKITPFIQGYQLDIHEGKVYYRDACNEDSQWQETIIKIDDLVRYYEQVTKMEKDNKLMPEPLIMDSKGEKANYTARQYCHLKELCCGKCKIDKLDLWVDKVLSKNTVK